MRTVTRKERAANKAETSIWMPVSVACVNFGSDGNLAFLIRAAACFGAKNIYVIGNTSIKRAHLNDLSGSTYDFVNIVFFQNPMEFLSYCRNRNIKLVSLEISDTMPTTSLDDYKFDFSAPENCIVVGSETTGVPVEVMKNSDIVTIPMRGISFCLNTSQTANIALYVSSKQYAEHKGLNRTEKLYSKSSLHV
jgi:tRNA G18 (ribose-2'-O)-methylase SpoU